MRYALVVEYPSPVDSVNKGLLTDGAGEVIKELLLWSGIPWADCKVFAVFPERPMGNNPAHLFGGTGPKHHVFGRLKEENVPILENLISELKEYNPDVVICLGSIPLWALTGESRLSEYRGTPQEAHGLKVIATEAPASCLKVWSLRPVIAMDLAKAKKLAATAVVTYPARRIMIVESLADADEAVAACRAAGAFAYDVETMSKQVTCISLGISSALAYVIPFWNLTRADKCHWDEATEVELWWKLWNLFRDPTLGKIAHNAVYDLSYMKHHGIMVAEPVHDTMLQAHAYQIEWSKGLGFLGSIHTDERSWKLLRVGAKKDRNKAEE